jgi:hypothetical protein
MVGENKLPMNQDAASRMNAATGNGPDGSVSDGQEHQHDKDSWRTALPFSILPL